MISRRGQIASANRAMPPYSVSHSPNHLPVETRRKCTNRRTAWKYRRRWRFLFHHHHHYPRRLTVEALEITISTERKVITTLVAVELMLRRQATLSPKLFALPSSYPSSTLCPSLSWSFRASFFFRSDDKLDLIITTVRDYDTHHFRSNVQLVTEGQHLLSSI